MKVSSLNKMNEIVSEGGNETVLPPIVADINWQTGETEDVSNARCRSNPLVTMVSDGYSQFFRSNVFGPSGFWTMAPLRYTGKFDPFLSLDCARVEGVGAQSKFCHLATMQSPTDCSFTSCC